MRNSLILFAMVLAGCATQHRSTVGSENRTAAGVPTQSRLPKSVRVCTRYELGAYRYPAESQDKPFVLRSTQVPRESAIIASSLTYESPALAPLPQSAELQAEIAAQREITQRMQQSASTVQALATRMQAEFTTLKQQSKEVAQLRSSLERQRGAPEVQSPASPPHLQQQNASQASVPASNSTGAIKW